MVFRAALLHATPLDKTNENIRKPRPVQAARKDEVRFSPGFWKTTAGREQRSKGMGGELGLGPFATDETVPKPILRRWEKEKLSNFEQFTSLSRSAEASVTSFRDTRQTNPQHRPRHYWRCGSHVVPRSSSGRQDSRVNPKYSRRQG